MENQDLDIFNVNMDAFESKAPSTNSSKADLFKPDPKQAKDNVYTAVLRPVYWLGNPAGFNPKDNFIEKKTFYLKNAADEGGYFDSPASIGEKCEAMGAFFKLKKEGKTDQRSEDLAGEIRPTSSYFYLVLIEKDLINPDNEGKLMIWKAPIQVHKIINGKVNPDEKAQKLGKKSEDIMNPLAGRSFEVNVGLKGGFWNYDGCEFQESRPVTYKGEAFTPEAKGEFVEFIKTGDELMKTYIYSPMAADRKELLLDIITEKTGITFGSKTSAPKRAMEISNVEAPTNNIDDVLAEVETSAPSGNALKDARPADTASADTEGEINNFLEDLDLDLD